MDDSSPDPHAALRPPHAVVLGIDVVGTKMAAGVVGPGGEVYSYVRELTPTDVDGEGLFSFVVALARGALQASRARPTALGIGCRGPMIFSASIVSPLHIPVWQAFPLRA